MHTEYGIQCLPGESAEEMPLDPAFGMLSLVCTTCGWTPKGRYAVGTLKVYGRRTGHQMFSPAPYRSAFSRTQERTTEDSGCDQNTEIHGDLSLGDISG